MDTHFHGDGDGFEVRLRIRWVTLNALCKAAVTTAISLLVLWSSLAEHLHRLV